MSKKKDTYTAEFTHYSHPEEVVNEDTGEVAMRLTEHTVTRTVEVNKDYVDLKLPKKFKFNNGPFITIFQKAILNIAMLGNLTKNEMHLLLYLIGSCGVKNSISTDLDKLSADLGIKKPNVSTALGGLCKRNIVIRKDGYRYGKTPLPFELHLDFDQINYSLGYNGKATNFHNDKNTHPQLLQADGETPLLESKSKQKALPTLEEALFDESYNVNQKKDFEPLHLMNALEEPEEE